MPPLAEIVGSKVRQLRQLRGLSQETLAEDVGVTPETISNIERAQHPPSLATLERILVALEVSPAEFFQESAGPSWGTPSATQKE